MLTPGNLTGCYWKWPVSSLIYILNMVMFHRFLYVYQAGWALRKVRIIPLSSHPTKNSLVATGILQGDGRILSHIDSRAEPSQKDRTSVKKLEVITGTKIHMFRSSHSSMLGLLYEINHRWVSVSRTLYPCLRILLKSTFFLRTIELVNSQASNCLPTYPYILYSRFV